MLDSIKQTLTKANKPTLLYAIVAILPIVGFAPRLPGNMIYLVVELYALYCIFKAKRIDVLMTLFLIYIPIELIIAQPPSVFGSWYRYIFFAFLMMSVSPLLQSKLLRKYREQIFQYVMWTCVFIGVGSFFARFLGINYMTSGYQDAVDRVGLFGGLTIHSMMLGPIAGVGACFLANRAMSIKNKMGWTWMILALFAVFFSDSRSALLAAITGVVITMYFRSGTTSRFVKYAIVALVISASTFSLWEGALTGVIEKNGTTTELDYSSREELWDERIEEFRSSPLVGIGFCAASLKRGSLVDLSTGRVESGTSWLIIFSMLGMFGAMIIFPILFRAFNLARQRKDDIGAVLSGVLALFFVHMFAEGYIFAGGSFLAFMLWLTVGVATDSKYLPKQ